jgi:hypothetical protein
MFENNLVFSLVLTIIVMSSFYLFGNKELTFRNNEKKNEFLLLFALIFSLSFLMKCISSKDVNIKVPNNTTMNGSMVHSSRPPF